MRLILAIGIGIALASPMLAEEAGLSDPQTQVLTCPDVQAVGTEWGGQCVGLTFDPCADQDVGSEGHVACTTQLTQLMGQWFGLVAQSCFNFAVDKEPGFDEVAKLGCEVSEMAGVRSEFVACHDGRSTATYRSIQG